MSKRDWTNVEHYESSRVNELTMRLQNARNGYIHECMSKVPAGASYEEQDAVKEQARARFDQWTRTKAY